MNFSKWPSWLKGGIIGAGLAMAALPLATLCAFTIGNLIGWWCWLWFYVPVVPIVLWLFDGINPLSAPVSNAVGVAIWFLGGCLVGWIVGIIKSRKNQKPLR